MRMTNADRLSTPTDMVELLKYLTRIMRDVESFPDAAQQRFWDEAESALCNLSSDDVLLKGEAGTRSVTVLYNMLLSICGPKLTEMVSGMSGITKEYYENIIANMKKMPNSAWDAYLDQKFDETKGTDHEGEIFASVTLCTRDKIGDASLSWVDGISGVLRMTDPSGEECYSLSKDIIMLEDIVTVRTSD
jgi:hypothetical protein